MSAAPAPALAMSDGQRESLQVLARARSAPHRQVQRARALLLAADGVANTRIADTVDAIVEATLHSKPKGETHWSTRTMAKQFGVSRSTVHEIWRARGLKPH